MRVAALNGLSEEAMRVIRRRGCRDKNRDSLDQNVRSFLGTMQLKNKLIF